MIKIRNSFNLPLQEILEEFEERIKHGDFDKALESENPNDFIIALRKEIEVWMVEAEIDFGYLKVPARYTGEHLPLAFIVGVAKELIRIKSA